MDGSERRGWSYICTTKSHVHTLQWTYWTQIFTHTECLLTAKKSYWVNTVWVIWKLSVREGYPAVPTSNHYVKTANFLTSISVFNLKHNVLAKWQILNELGLIFTFSFCHTLLGNFQPKISPKKPTGTTQMEIFFLFSVYAGKICFHAF